MKIKNMALLLIISFVFISYISAQEKSYSAGAQIMFNIASWYGTDAENLEAAFGNDTKARFGMGFNAIFAINYGKFFSIQTEILFTSKGKKYHLEYSEFDEWDSTTWKIDEKIKYKLTYMEFPVLAKVRIPINKKVRPYFYAGPVIGLLLSSKAEIDMREEEDGDVFEMSAEVDVKDDFRKIDINLAFGGGLAIKVGPGSIVSDFRYTHGFVKVFTEEDGDLYMGGMEIKNLVFSIMTGYVLDF